MGFSSFMVSKYYPQNSDMVEGRWGHGWGQVDWFREKGLGPTSKTENSITFQHGSRRFTVAGLHKDLNMVGFLKPLHFIWALSLISSLLHFLSFVVSLNKTYPRIKTAAQNEDAFQENEGRLYCVVPSIVYGTLWEELYPGNVRALL